MSEEQLNEWQKRRAEKKRVKAEEKIVKDARWDNERMQRKLEHDARKFAEQTSDDKKAQPLNAKHRAEDIKHRVTEMAPVTTPRPNVDPTPPHVDEMEVFVWKDGEMGTILIAVTRPFQPL
jgi:hypothetical protein